MLNMGDIRKGVMVVLDDQPFLVQSAEFLRKQQRRPVVRAVLKNLKTGNTKEHTFMQSDKIVEADVVKKPWQFLYKEKEMFVFMDEATFEQFELTDATLGDSAKFLVEGQSVDVVLFGDEPVSVELPIKIDRKVIEAAPGVKGDTATNVMKDVVIEGGATVKAPLFITVGDTIRINTRDGAYVERAD